MGNASSIPGSMSLGVNRSSRASDPTTTNTNPPRQVAAMQSTIEARVTLSVRGHDDILLLEAVGMFPSSKLITMAL